MPVMATPARVRNRHSRSLAHPVRMGAKLGAKFFFSGCKHRARAQSKCFLGTRIVCNWNRFSIGAYPDIGLKEARDKAISGVDQKTGRWLK
jgi:hypothetical protein